MAKNWSAVASGNDQPVIVSGPEIGAKHEHTRRVDEDIADANQSVGMAVSPFIETLERVPATEHNQDALQFLTGIRTLALGGEKNENADAFKPEAQQPSASSIGRNAPAFVLNAGNNDEEQQQHVASLGG